MPLEILGGYIFLGTKTDEREEEMGFGCGVLREMREDSFN